MKNSAHGELVEPCELCASVVKISSHETRKNQFLEEAHRLSMAQRFYVVWSGRQTGVFTDWATTQRAVDKYAGARFKSFPTRAEAEQAFGRGGAASIPTKTPSGQKTRTPDGEHRATHTAHQFD